MNSDSSNAQSIIAEKLRPISGIVLHVRSVLYWEQPYHAVLLTSAITLIFTLFWLIDASILSKSCIFAIIAIILDFALPIINGFVSKKWIDENEAKFESFCQNISTLCCNTANFYNGYCQLKQTNTKTYYGSLLTALLIAAWIGSIVHNLLLTYLITLGLALYPGLSKQDSFNEYMAGFASRILSLMPAKSRKSKKN